MTNIYLIALVLILFLCNYSLSNAQVEAVKYKMKIYDLPVYNKATGELISDKKIKKFKEKDPNFILEPIINKSGNVDSYWYDPNRGNRIIERDASKQSKFGEEFPPFVMYSIRENTFDSEKLKGNVVLLFFQLSFEEPFFSKQKFEEFDTLVGEFGEKSNLEAIVITESSRREVNKQVNFQALNEDIVTDGRNFNIRYSIVKFPTAILIDKEGKLVRYYQGFGELSELKTDVNIQLLSQPAEIANAEVVNQNDVEIASAANKPRRLRYFLNFIEFDPGKLYINPKNIDSIRVEKNTPNGEVYFLLNRII